MMREWKFGLWLIVLSCCVPMAFAEPAGKVPAGSTKEDKAPVDVSRWRDAPASLVMGAHTTPEEDYDAAVKADGKGDAMGALKLYKRAADGGHAKAQVQTAFILSKSGYMEDAVSYYRKAAEQGNVDGQFGLGTSYAGGEGVKKDLIEARKWITLAAKQGHIEAISVMADAYIEGGLGLDDAVLQGAEALNWIRLAADNNYHKAIIALIDAYSAGKYGLAPDPEKAKELYKKLGKEDIKKTSSKKRR